jgi:predicted nucleic acid-binding protein
VDPFFAALDRGNLRVVTSIVTLIEAMIQPMRQGDAALTSRYEDLLLDTAHIDTLDLTGAIAQEATRLRAAHNLRTPDAIQLATALQAGAAAFLTNDARFSAIPDIRVIVLDALPPA